jgi:hypothetical protein
MENKVVNIEIKNNIVDVTKQVRKLSDSFEDTSKDIKDIQKSTKSAEGGVKSLADGFKGMGLAVKAIGIGLVMEAFNMFKEILGKNQKVVDLFNTAIGALSIAFNDLIGFVMNNFPSVVKIFKDVFENPTKYLQKFGDLIKENLIERFNSFLDTVGYLGSALKKVFEGDFAGAMDSVKQAGKESIDVLTGVNNTVDRSKKAIGDAAEAIGNYAVKTFKASEANVKLQNSAILAAAEQGRLVEQYDRQAEKLRQVRDNDLLSIDDRIKANDKLKGVLEKQQAAMLAQADLQVAAARATYAMNKSIENQAAVTDALANKEGVLAQVEGLRSENIANNISLQKEKIALGQSEVEGLNALAIEQKKFNETLETDELKKLENQRANLEEEKRIELERLQLKINGAAQGTQARVDAELEYATKKQEIDNALITNSTETNKVLLSQEKAVADGKKAIQEQSFAVAEGGINLLKGLFQKNKGIQKALLVAESAMGIAKIIINTQAANAADRLYAATLGPVAGPIYLGTKLTLNKVGAGIGIAANIAATSKALGALGGGGTPSGSSSGGEGGGGGTAPAAPAFNVVGASPTNQIAQTIANQQQQPIKAYVVSNDVTTAQSLDRNIISSASIG